MNGLVKGILASLIIASSSAAIAKDVTIGAILLDTKGEWMSEVMHGMKQAGEDLNIKVRVADSSGDLAKEASIMDNFVAQGVDAITISPQNDEASAAAFDRAVNSGIPVVTWNSKVNSENMKYFVGVNNYDLGKETGEVAVRYINENMGGNAKIAVIGTSKYSVGLERVNGFLDQVTKLPGVEIVARQDAEYVELGMSVTEAILQAKPETDMIWAWNLTSMLGAYAAVKTQGLDDMVMMGTDMSLDVARFMQEEGTFLKAVTTQQPFEIGYQAVTNAYELATKGETKSEVLVPLRTYVSGTPAELKEYIESRDYL
ncbi:sugar ABC transporter substrate-binding protein [Alginatibacterium sediminis]|uniref:Sugar ABC transporter substrate-binding protein n=1 Tax=Alginatibacterium sediminis TaxID=2164068 RepID=A0A420EGI0_9ALTE|nr:substrate-binding domain-containing protein [Alginatibacterium sediminis]RKF19788.1 sugar ABC transporter substrate-binding protein [Alginatibacterium sediminis]